MVYEQAIIFVQPDLDSVPLFAGRREGQLRIIQILFMRTETSAISSHICTRLVCWSASSHCCTSKIA